MTMLAAWWTWLAVASLHAALAIPIVAMLDRCGGARRWPLLQATLWTMVMVRLLTPPALAVFVPAAFLDRLPDASRLAIAQPAVAPIVLAAFAMWLTGVVASGSWLVWRYRRLRAFCADGREAPESVTAIARAAAARLGLAVPPPVVIHDRVAVPATIGIRAPMVVLPRALVDERDAARADLEHVLLHELAHVRRRDACRAIAATVVQVLYWFHPLVWIARARLAALREMACDREVARLLGSPDDYRRTLIRLARSMAEPPVPLVAGARLFARRSELLVRLDVLASPPRSSGRLARAVAVLLCAAMIPALAVIDAAAATRTLAADAANADLAGCLRLRYAVYAALAQEAAGKEQR
jgi:beta-lactamase regulating signal transducer with metallopeptidase domain